MLSPPISISRPLFGCRYSNSRDLDASSPSFSRPANRAPRRACSLAATAKVNCRSSQHGIITSTGRGQNHDCSGLFQTARALDNGHSRQSHQALKAVYFSIKIGYLSWKMEVGCPSRHVVTQNIQLSAQHGISHRRVTRCVTTCYSCSAHMKTKSLDKNNNNEDDDNGKQTNKKAKTN